jgi:hypothetical protein
VIANLTLNILTGIEVDAQGFSDPAVVVHQAGAAARKVTDASRAIA